MASDQTSPSPDVLTRPAEQEAHSPRTPETPPPSRRLIDFRGLERIPDLAADLLRASPGPPPQAVTVGVGQS